VKHPQSLNRRQGKPQHAFHAMCASFWQCVKRPLFARFERGTADGCAGGRGKVGDTAGKRVLGGALAHVYRMRKFN